MSWIPQSNDLACFASDDRDAIEELCKRAIVLIRSGSQVDSPELALLLHAIGVLAFAMAERMLIGWSRNRELDAKEVADTFIDLVLRAGLPKYDTSRPFLPYATTTIRRLCSVQQRRSRIRSWVGLPEEVADARQVASARLERQDMRAAVRSAVRRLPQKLRRAVIARYWLGLCPRLAAVRLGTNVNTLNGWMWRARKILRDLLKDDLCVID